MSTMAVPFPPVATGIHLHSERERHFYLRTFQTWLSWRNLRALIENAIDKRQKNKAQKKKKTASQQPMYNCTMYNSGVLWSTLEYSGHYRSTLEHSEALWTSGALFRTLEYSEILCRTVQHSAAPWSPLERSGILCSPVHYVQMVLNGTMTSKQWSIVYLMTWLLARWWFANDSLHLCLGPGCFAKKCLDHFCVMLMR